MPKNIYCHEDRGCKPATVDRKVEDRRKAPEVCEIDVVRSSMARASWLDELILLYMRCLTPSF
jgi:hypothetical protein